MKAKEAKQHVSTRCPSVLSQREKIYLLAVTQSFYHVKFRFSEKNTKFEKKNLPLVLTLLKKTAASSKQVGDFFKFCGILKMSLLYLFGFRKRDLMGIFQGPTPKEVDGCSKHF